jgi:uncharacterized membrane protein (DUF4010 family)
MADLEILHRLAVALVVGLIIGFERGWHLRQAPEGSRIAGLRTFALVAAAGGLASVLGLEFHPTIAAALTLAIGGLLVAVRIMAREPDIGATTEVALLVTLALGLLAGIGHLIPALGGAVVTALLLGAKETLHGWLRIVERQELMAVLQLVLISMVILPLLPNEGVGPYGVLNPFRLWLMVVLVAGVSFTSYLIMKLLGSRAGVLLAGISGGLISSTATTVALARRSKSGGEAIGGGVAAAHAPTATPMVVRIFILAVAIQPAFWSGLGWPLGAAAVTGIAATWLLWRRDRKRGDVQADGAEDSPLNLGTAAAFTFVLAVVLILVEAVRRTFGTAGVYALSAISAVVDTDAIALSLAEQASRELPLTVAIGGITIAVMVNTLVKAAIVHGAGSPNVARSVTGAVVAVVVAGITGWSVQAFLAP